MNKLTSFANPIQRAAWCAAMATINHAHLEFWCEHNQYKSDPYRKLNNKLHAYLRGELKSLANLERFHESFAQWRVDLPSADNLAYRIAEFCCAALYSGVESILDPECDDTALLRGNLVELYQELTSLSDDSQPLQVYHQEIEFELAKILQNSAQPPLEKAYFELLDQLDTSLFGL